MVQLFEGLEDAWAKLGETPEPGLTERVDAFVEGWTRPKGGNLPRWEELPHPEERRCDHCGYNPDILRASWRADHHDAIREGLPANLSSSIVVSLASFPRGEWEKATAVWPDLLDDLPADHDAYSHRIEARMKRLARALAGHPMRVSPITVDGLTDFCAEEDDAPGTGEARSAYAAEIARRRDALLWPPGRNAPCWCGSGRKYKTCCGPIPMAQE